MKSLTIRNKNIDDRMLGLSSGDEVILKLVDSETKLKRKWTP